MSDSGSLSHLTHRILGSAFKVHSQLGGFLPEQVYQTSLMIEFNNRRIQANSEVYFPVYYDNKLVGKFMADIVVQNKVILELKSIDHLYDKHIAQLLNYMRVSNIKLGYLLNFGGRSLEYKRLIL